MKLCIECMYFIHNGDRCARTSGIPDYLRGQPTKGIYAQVERISIDKGSCGPDAKYFREIPIAKIA